MRRYLNIFTAVMMCMTIGCVKNQSTMSVALDETPRIIAELSVDPATRTCIDAAAADQEGTLPVLWSPDDQLGVYVGSHSNVLYTNEEQTWSIPNTSFAATEVVSGEILAVYYPYDDVNASNEYTSLEGTVPAEQVMDGNIAGDYKWGEYISVSESGGYKFKFHNMFSLARFKIDATGTVLNGEMLETVTFAVTRDDEAVPVTGSFTFDATDGNYTLGTTSNTLTTVWNQALDGTLSGFASVLPEVKTGDRLTFIIETPNYTATLSVTVKTYFEPEMYYTFPLTLANFSKLSITKKVTGTFKAATYNVDGLPKKISFFTINGDGPGSDGTKTISSAIAADNWDFVGFSEDFAYHTELTSALGAYTFGKYRGSVSSILSNDTDGLGFATRNSTCSFSNENIVAFTSSYGGVESGANTCIKKGFRHYAVALADGTEIDVIITHMNTYSSSGTGHINAQHAQLKQVAQYINSIRSNNRPIIFMGDTNCRYTRHDFQTYFWGVLDSDLEVNDPWVDFMWEGVYPTYPSNSLVVEDATGTSSSDIICDSQKGEVVDKIIYINNPNATVQISANGYMRDPEYQGLADHWPIVVEFSYKTNHYEQ